MAEFDQESDIIFLYNNSSYNNYEDYESGSENENEEQVLSIGKEFDSWKKVNRFFDEYALSKAHFDETDGRLTSIFWMFPTQKQLWLRYHDVVINDSTYKKNRYDLTLNIIVCIDCDNHTRLVACALVDDEIKATFKWIYENIKIATGNIVPYSIYTDGDPTMFRTIKSVFDTTVHFICIYHIDQNIQKKLKSVLGSNFTQFHKDFYQAQNSFNVEKFNFYWEKLKNNYPSAVSYLNRVLDQNRTV
ncbi:unnamed protein product [Rhizophagus irregularis]|nr:unnamed protein product [Rhizophagus irregularis]